ncbi:phosphatidylglycerophosphatase and protein-tyrosine phosphatase 1 [Bombina bombina]|uniref:phosphatidylglycerophosphatase and protein-tyrosine phosphatase 1 n=1 Tax=Bombina bombina TaxID=8345 RepID=UPI00235B02F5|nr:phosphatidylglycerophosphatase and protein-tyrosine phosphatase 1 [Bombina bombina]
MKHDGESSVTESNITTQETADMTLMSVAARAAFYPSLLYNVLMKHVTHRKWYNRIDETVILGALPFRGMSPSLLNEENVRGVITMNEEYETRLLCHSAEEWRALGVEQLRLSTVDYMGVPSLENLKKGAEFVHKHQQMGNSVYIHCKAGRSRSATMVAAYLIQRHKWKPNYATDYIAGIRPHILIRPKQFLVLEEFYSSVTGSGAPEGGG